MNAQKLQSSVEGAGQFQLLVEDGDYQIGGHRNPYLRLHRVGTRAVEVFDPQMLLDPSEEQLDAPSHLVKHGHCQRRDLQVVGEEDQFPCGFRVVVAYLSQKSGKGISRFGETRLADMIAAQAGEAIHRQRVVPGELQFAFGPCDEEGSRVGNQKEAGEIHIAAIHQIECPGFEQQAVEPADVVLACSGDMNAGWNRAPQVDLGVHLDARLGLPEVGPRKEGQREVDGRRVEGIDGVVEVESKILARIQCPCLSHEALGKVFPKPPVALFVGIREGGLRHRLAESQVMQSRRPRIQTGCNVPQSLAPSQLGKYHADELLTAAEVADTRFGVVASDQSVERLTMDEIENLGEDEAAGVHGPEECPKSLKSPKASHHVCPAIHSSTESFKDDHSC